MDGRLACSLLAAIVVGASACNVKTPAVHRILNLSAGYANWEGAAFVYALPRSVFRAEYEAAKTTFEDPQCPLSVAQAKDDDSDQVKAEKREWRRSLAIKEVPSKKGVARLFSLTKPKLSVRAEPDPAQLFRMEPAPRRLLADATLLLKLGEDGVVQGVEASSQDQVGPTVVKVIEAVGAIVGAAVALGAPQPDPLEPSECKDKLGRLVELDGARRLWEAAPVPYPKDTFEKIVALIKAEQTAIRALFLGVKQVETAKIICDIRIDEAGTGRQPFLELYAEEGLKPMPIASCKMPTDFRRTANSTAPKVDLSVTLEKEPQTVLQGWQARRPQVQQRKKAGVFYRVPAPYWVGLDGPKKTRLPGTLYLVPQLGRTEAIDRVKGRNPKLKVTLYAATGALKEVSIERNSPDVAAVAGATGTSAATIITAVATRQAAEQAAAKEEKAAREAEDALKAPLALLQQEQALLEAELAIFKATEALEQYRETTPAAQP
jgi:hypothetical protein